jgi:type I restriction enzyme S subunit
VKVASEWKMLPIKELYEGLYDGPHATPKPSDSGPVFLGIKNVTDDGRLDLADIRHIAEHDYAAWTRRVEPRENDLVFTYEATLNRYAVIPPGFRGCLGRRMALIRTDPQKLDVRFLLYYFFTKEWRTVIQRNLLTGATVDRIPLTTFPDFPVRVPPLQIQQRIAGILSAYDDLIENSQRRIKTLESMARALYREWFVHFRFPGHESVPRVPSPLGDIPQGWEVKKLGEICARMESGGTPRRSTAEYWKNGDIDWYKTGELWDGFLFGAQERITARGQSETTARLFEPGTILMAIYGSPTVGRMGILTSYASCNQAALGLVADRRLISQTYLFFVLYSLRNHFNGLAQGAAQQNISKEKVAGAMAVVPLHRILESFDDNVEPIFAQIRTLQQQIQNLRRTRDLLLPRLLAGQIDVAAIDHA